ncbi:MAG TPA: Rne/Rng family ribonuclease [Terriglobales bacterium]|nr:Rne/Rng family ribonuclease [Terriglobales bacterium]
MNKELYVSSTPHETRLALTEDGEVAEVYYEREKEYSLAGSIYKGRVTRVLPGMQSAFVDIGLERDAFLYVSDFFEDSDEYDRVVSEAESAVAKQLERPAAGAAAPAAPTVAEPGAAASEDDRRGRRGGRGGRNRGRRGRGSFIPEEKFARPEETLSPEEDGREVEAAPAAAEVERADNDAGEVVAAPASLDAPSALVLPGESLAKYRQTPPAPPRAVTAAPAPVAPVPVAPPRPVAGGRAPEPATAAAALVLPGESLAKYRSIAPVAPPTEVELDPGAEALEAEQAEEMQERAEREEAVFERAEEQAFEATAQEDVDLAPEEETGEDASAGLRGPELESRLQAPARNAEGQPGRRGRHRRRRRGGADKEAAPEGAPTPAAPTARETQRESQREGKNESSRLIGDLLREGQEILIQIAKEPLGKKGARITSHLALPGRFLVYMPTVHHIGVSRKIGSDEERARLKRFILENTKDLPGGFIVRTAAAGAEEDELQADIRLLASQWNDLRQQFEQVKSPALLHHDLNLVERTLRDQLSQQFTHIWVDTDEQYQRVVKFVSYFMPQLTDRVRLYTRDEPLFEHAGLQAEINKALQSKVWLKSGGYIVLNQTEALVAIDVNTGKYVGRSSRLEDTIVKTNVEAIREIVRQIRLRDLGGIIVIDFIDMDEKRNRQRVMQALEEEMRADRAPSKILAFNDFGLVALTRKRVKQSLERTLGSPCPYCEGVGLVKSPVTVCNEIYLEVKKLAPSIEREDLVLRVNPEVAKVLKAQGAQRLREMEDVAGKGISVRPDPQVHQGQFEIY